MLPPAMSCADQPGASAGPVYGPCSTTIDVGVTPASRTTFARPATVAAPGKSGEESPADIATSPPGVTTSMPSSVADSTVSAVWSAGNAWSAATAVSSLVAEAGTLGSSGSRSQRTSPVSSSTTRAPRSPICGTAASGSRTRARVAGSGRGAAALAATRPGAGAGSAGSPGMARGPSSSATSVTSAPVTTAATSTTTHSSATPARHTAPRPHQTPLPLVVATLASSTAAGAARPPYRVHGIGPGARGVGGGAWPGRPSGVR